MNKPENVPETRETQHVIGEIDCPSSQSVAQPPTALPLVRVPEAEDYETWTDEALIERGQVRLTQGDRQDAKRIVLGRMSIEARLEAGHVLSIIRRRHKDDGEWCEIQEKNSLSRTTVWEVITAYERSTAMGHSRDQVASNYETWTEVLVAYGIVKERQRKAVCGPVEAEPATDAVGTAASEDKSAGAVTEAETASGPNSTHTGQQEGVCAQPDGQLAGAVDVPVASSAPEQHSQGEGDTQPARPATPNAKRVTKRDHADLSACEIDAATIFIKAVGSWDRAVQVIELMQDIVGG